MENNVESREWRVENWKRALVAVALVGALVAPSVWAQQVHQPAAAPSPSAAFTPSGERKILYWYDPMHPQYRSDKPGTAPDCGMDLVPKYADEPAAPQNMPAGTVQISPFKQQLIGVRTAPVTRRVLEKDIRTVGIVRPDEGRIRKVHTKFPGWVDQLFVTYTGEPVRAGDPILSIYSPDLVSTQTEYLLARRGDQQLHGSPFPEAATGAKALLDAARRRLLLWDITPQQIRELEETGKPRTALTLHSPASGFVTVKDVYQGLYVTPDKELYTIVDLSRVWVLLDIYESEMPSVHPGMPVTLRLRSQPGDSITGAITYIYPYLDNQTRTNKVRVEFDNPGLRFKPDMYATGEIHALLGERLVVPQDAVLDSGIRRIVFVALGDGFFEPREVRLGERGEDYAEVLEGVREGEQVVVGANFMVDSESQLKAALSTMGGMEGMPGMKMDSPP
ncbi:MAG: efflux RND transporter periplasmic adaptor subunit [Candidatus Binatia bacterium]|jgi:RND family efflux transporter MFP subunit